MHNHLNDTELFNLTKAGNEAAFTELYRRYWKRMFAMAYLRLDRRELAEDIVQDVFASLWNNREKADIQNVEAWLATAVKYGVMMLVNRRLSREVMPGEQGDISFADNTIDYRFLEQHIAAEMNRLPEKCRLVFTYSREHGYSNAQIAEELNISEKAVEKHITRARKHLALSLRHLLQSLF